MANAVRPPDHLRERINRNGPIDDLSVPGPLLTLEEFFEGNEDYGSIQMPNGVIEKPSKDEFSSASLVLYSARKPEMEEIHASADRPIVQHLCGT